MEKKKKSQDEASSPLSTFMTLVETNIFKSVEENSAISLLFFFSLHYVLHKIFKPLSQNITQTHITGFPF